MRRSLALKILIPTLFLLLFSVVGTGLLSYLYTRKAYNEEIRSDYLRNYMISIGNEMEVEIGKAIEASLTLASSPVSLAWVEGEEQDQRLKNYVLDTLDMLTQEFGYFTTFLVSNTTYNYWSNGQTLLDVVDPSDPDDSWFFSSMESPNPYDLNLDYNEELGDTFIFVNAYMRRNDRMLGTAGVGVTLTSLVSAFDEQISTEDTSILLTNQAGEILVSNTEALVGSSVEELFTGSNFADLQQQLREQYVDLDGLRYALIEKPILGSDYSFVLAVPERELSGFIDSILYFTMAAIAASVLIAILLLLLIVRYIITRPIIEAVRFAEQVAAGDLRALIESRRRDEIGQLSSSLQQMGTKLGDIMGEIRIASDQVNSSSQQMSDTAAMLSEGASQQASSIEEVSSSMEEISANISQNAENATETERIASSAASEAEESGEAVREAVSAMRSIAEKISIIEEIARQTNMLSLNASIEAARAGEHGKGFAVVAAEVGKLAARSKEAAVEISDVSRDTLVVSERAEKTLSELVPTIRKTAELVQEIGAASREQNGGVQQINQAVSQLDIVVQQNAASSEELASIAAALAGQAGELERSIAYFRLNGEASEEPLLLN